MLKSISFILSASSRVNPCATISRPPFVSIMIILCTVKRFEAYETIGALFRETTTGTLELSASNRIWELILDTILASAVADASVLLSAVIDANPKFHKLYQMYKLGA